MSLLVITIMHIYSAQLKYLWFSLPPFPEQQAIVQYTDQEAGAYRRRNRSRLTPDRVGGGVPHPAESPTW